MYMCVRTHINDRSKERRIGRSHQSHDKFNQRKRGIEQLLDDVITGHVVSEDMGGG